MMRLLTFAMFASLAGCVTSSEPEDTCQITDVSTIVEDPEASDGKMFCGAMYAHFDDLLTLHSAPVESIDEKLGTALVVSNEVARNRFNPKDFSLNEKVFVSGTIDVKGSCLLKAGQGTEHICTPIRHPIFLLSPVVKKQGR